MRFSLSASVPSVAISLVSAVWETRNELCRMLLERTSDVSFNFADIFRASREKIFISYGLIINNYHRCMLRHIEWYACGCLLLIFRESALVKHSFYEKLSDNDLLLTNANALLSVQYRYHALSLVSVIWETRTSFAEWYMKGSPKHYGRWKKNTSFT